MKRSVAAPDIGTVAASGVPGFEMTTWYGFAAHGKLSRAIVDYFHGELVKAIDSPGTREKLLNQGAETIANTPAQATAQAARKIANWTNPRAGVRLEPLGPAFEPRPA